MADPGRYLQCVRTLRDYAGKGCWEAQVCDSKGLSTQETFSLSHLCQTEHICFQYNFLHRLRNSLHYMHVSTPQSLFLHFSFILFCFTCVTTVTVCCFPGVAKTQVTQTR